MLELVKNFVKNILKKETFSRILSGINIKRTKKDKEIWEKAILLKGFQNLNDSLIFELQKYFGYSKEEILKKIEKPDLITRDFENITNKENREIAESYNSENYFFSDLVKSYLGGTGYVGLRKSIGALELAIKKCLKESIWTMDQE